MSYLSSFAAPAPRLIAIAPSQTTEVVRWSLDRLGIPYQEIDHVPFFHVFFTFLAAGTVNIPLLQLGETTLTTNHAILDYYDARCLDADRLVPIGNAQTILQKFDFFNGDFSLAVAIWTYAYLFENRRSTLLLWTWHVGWLERLLAFVCYPLLALILRKAWNISSNNIETSLGKIQEAFTDVETQLSDGRPYLFGNTFTAADMAFACNAAPLLLPDNYGGPQASFDILPPEIKVQIEKFRESEAGKWVLHIYKTKRATIAQPALPSISFGSRFYRTLTSWTVPWFGNFLVRAGFNLLRSFFPFFKFAKTVIVSDFRQVTEVLGNDEAFSISQINAQRMENTVGPFVLGMDASNPRWRPEKDLLNAAVGREDLEWIPSISQGHALPLLKAASNLGRIEAVNGYARLAALRFVRTYFGVPGPDEPTMARWMRTLFNELFLNIGNDPTTTKIAKQSAAELEVYLRKLIAERIEQQIENPKPPVDVLDRLLDRCPTGDLMSGDEAVRRSISGLIIGAVDTTSAASIRVIDELLRHPHWLK